MYTSGKGSSAAGLTASVQRDSVSASPSGIFIHGYEINDVIAAGILSRGRSNGSG